MASRGRARGRAAPGNGASAGIGPAPVGGPARGRGAGRGRGRGAAAVEAPPSEQMGQLNIQAPGESAPSNPIVRERGSRFTPIIHRPENVTSVTGTSGQPVDMLTNAFEIKVLNNQPLYQYHVDFKPAFATDSLPLRKAMVHKIECLRNRHLFDGMILYCPIKLTETEFLVETKREEKVTIVLKLTKEVTTSSEEFMKLANVIFNQIAANHMGLDRIRRDYFNPGKAVVLSQHKVELWPGYEFSIR